MVMLVKLVVVVILVLMVVVVILVLMVVVVILVLMVAVVILVLMVVVVILVLISQQQVGAITGRQHGDVVDCGSHAGHVGHAGLVGLVVQDIASRLPEGHAAVVFILGKIFIDGFFSQAEKKYLYLFLIFFLLDNN